LAKRSQDFKKANKSAFSVACRDGLPKLEFGFALRNRFGGIETGEIVALYLNRRLRSQVIHDLNAVNVALKS